MATFDQAASAAAAAAAASAKTAAEAAALILSKYGDFQTSANELVSQTAQTLRGEMTTSEANLRSEFQAADSELQTALNATNTNITNNYVKNTDYATATKAGLTKIGDNLKVDATGKISVPVATSSTLGVTRPGTNMSVSNGVLTFSLANYRGSVSIGNADGSAVLNMSANAVDIYASDNVRMRSTRDYAFGVLVNTGGVMFIRNNDITQRGGINCNYVGVEVGRSDLPLKPMGSGIGADGNLSMSALKMVTG